MATKNLRRLTNNLRIKTQIATFIWLRSSKTWPECLRVIGQIANKKERKPKLRLREVEARGERLILWSLVSRKTQVLQAEDQEKVVILGEAQSNPSSIDEIQPKAWGTPISQRAESEKTPKPASIRCQKKFQIRGSSRLVQIWVLVRSIFRFKPRKRIWRRLH